jgi:hypothetical protein
VRIVADLAGAFTALGFEMLSEAAGHDVAVERLAPDAGRLLDGLRRD